MFGDPFLAFIHDAVTVRDTFRHYRKWRLHFFLGRD